MSSSPTTEPAVPQHVAIIMDGNGRWAQQRGLPRTAGHKQGAETVRTTVEAAANLGIKYLTLFGFSTENWKRPTDEVDELMRLMQYYLRKDIAELHKNGVRVRLIGERSRIGPETLQLIENAEKTTAANDRLHLTIAFSYGGRQELTLAMQQLAAKVAAGELAAADISEANISAHLYTEDLPEPDLLIRTSGEQRISNFLLWQLAYSEMVFTQTLWPDFNKADLESAIEEYQRRNRRFGQVVNAQQAR